MRYRAVWWWVYVVVALVVVAAAAVFGQIIFDDRGMTTTLVLFLIQLAVGYGVGLALFRRL